MSTNPLYDLIQTVASNANSEAGTTTAGEGSGLSDALSGNTSQLEQLRSLFQSQIEAVNANTQKLTEMGSSASVSNSSPSGDVLKTVTDTLTSAFTLNPIVSGLMQLFGSGDDSTTSTTLAKFALPPAVNIDAGFSNAVSGLSPADYSQNGLPRAAAQPSASSISIQVNAMDSKSFMDHSEDIANAVRRAMLESSALNDVIAEL